MQLVNLLKLGMRGVFYGRHSTDKQEMIMQRVSVEEWLNRYNCTISKEYLDANVSATKRKVSERQALTRLLEDAEKGLFDFVAVYNDDRLARNPLEHEYIRSTMRIYGIPIVIKNTDSLYDSNNDLITQLVKDGISKYEVDNIKARTRDGLITRAKHGQWTGGNAPFGYRYHKEKKIFTQYGEEIEIVRSIFELYKKGEGFHSLVDKLPISSNRGQLWTKEKIKSIITNPFYAGFISWGKRTPTSNSTFTEREEWILVKSTSIEPTITQDDWELCWKMYQQKRQGHINPKHFKTNFLFNGLAVCSDCNELLGCKDQTTVSNTGKKYGHKIYYCKSCKLRIESEQFHSFVLDHIMNDIRLVSSSNITTNMKASFDRDIIQIERDIVDLNTSASQYLLTLDTVQTEIKHYMNSSTESENGTKLLKILILLRLHLNRRTELTNQMIKEKKLKIEQIQKVDLKDHVWNSIYQDIAKERNEIEKLDIRRMLVHLIEQITIDRNLNIEYKVKYDLSNRHINHLQLEFPL
jgi:site-specific DNA recombinase